MKTLSDLLDNPGFDVFHLAGRKTYFSLTNRLLTEEGSRGFLRNSIFAIEVSLTNAQGGFALGQ